MRWLLFFCLSLLLQPGFGQDTADASHGRLRASLSLDRSDAYIKEQILLTLTTAIPHDAFNLTHSKLEIDNVELVSLHRKEYTDNLDGTEWQIVEQRFAIFANAPGTVVIPEMRFRATLPVATQDRGGTGNPQLSATLAEQQLRIKAAPESASDWLSATDVSLTSRWSATNDPSKPVQLRRGEPQTRHISVEIKNQHPAAIATIKPTIPESIQSYPDQPGFEIRPSETGLNGTMTQPTVLVASQIGNFVLPELSLRWWHSGERVWKVSTLGREEIEVIAGAAGIESGNLRSAPYRYATLVLSSLLILLTALVVGLMIRLNRYSQLSRLAGPSQPISEPAAWARLRAALTSGNLNNIRSATIQWHRVLIPSSKLSRLDQLATDDSILQTLLGDIDRSLYHSPETKMDVDLAKLKVALIKLRRREKSRTVSHSKRSALYPFE